nr:LLM class flavin-dependent oxidoreductase [Halomicroarcula sp. SYNS111]
MATGLLLPAEHDDVRAFADRAESLGYDSLWASELWGRDAFVTLTTAAAQTETIDLGTAIVNVYGRSPATWHRPRRPSPTPRPAGSDSVSGRARPKP